MSTESTTPGGAGKLCIRRALISVWDKTGIVEFARSLHDEFGVEIISTGGTAKALTDAGIPVTLVETLTGCGEMLGGRVKTLHPAIHAAILADRDNPEHMRQLEAAGIKPIDMVVVNLYPFEKTVADPNCTFEQAIEMIDIGGVALLRAAAKNHRHVLAVVNHHQFESALEELRYLTGPREYFRKWLGLQAFERTRDYDGEIAQWLGRSHPDLWEPIPMVMGKQQDLRYGENPHQVAQLWGTSKFRAAHVVFGDDMAPADREAMSFNNYLDSNVAFELCDELARASKTGNRIPQYACCFVKHGNPCGVGVADDPIQAYERAYLGDPNAAMGGVLGISFSPSDEFVEVLMQTYERWGKARGVGGFFIEVLVAPELTCATSGAVLRARKPWGERVRRIAVLGMGEGLRNENSLVDIRFGAAGFLIQSRDMVGLNESNWKIATKRAPTDEELADLRLAWLICKHTKSNAISLVKDGRLIGNGAGQMSRVMSCRVATWLARENGHIREQETGLVAASDAFFPFSDGPKLLIDAGVTAIIQPGGSKRDQETIDLCDERGVAMIFTGTRHFRH